MFRRVLVLVWSLCFWGALAVNEDSTEPYSLRLVGGSRCQGQLQIQRPGEEWTGVHRGSFSREFGNRVCARLDCGSLLSVDGEKKEGVLNDAVRMESGYCNDTSLVKCFDPRYYNAEHTLVELNCSDSVRLVGEHSMCSGSLMMRDQSLNQSWTGVCEGALDTRGAEVLCRELGCGAPVLQGAPSPLGQTCQCEGHESSLVDCQWTQPKTRPENCSTLQLTCAEPMRLVGGSNRCEGMLELKDQGAWRKVTSFIHGFELQGASHVCRSLGCGSAISTSESGWDVLRSVWAVQPDCVSFRAVRDCVFSLFDGSRSVQRVVCSDSVRLVGEHSLCSGSLLMRDQSLNQSWTGVCEGALDTRGEQVLCRELGCWAPVLQGAPSPLGQTCQCEGHESSLVDCQWTQPRTRPENCSPLQLTCREPLRLVRGSNRCEGTLELKHQGAWRKVASFIDSIDLEAASNVCRSLGCGSAVSITQSDVLVSSVWAVLPDCVRVRPVRDCAFGLSVGYRLIQKVVCSGQ